MKSKSVEVKAFELIASEAIRSEVSFAGLPQSI
jgi:hypothetical protein